jgi:hypothetical protein
MADEATNTATGNLGAVQPSTATVAPPSVAIPPATAAQAGFDPKAAPPSKPADVVAPATPVVVTAPSGAPASQTPLTPPSGGTAVATQATSPLAPPVPPKVNSNTTPQLDPPTKPNPILTKDGAPIVPDKPKPEIVAQAGAVVLKSDGSKLTAETVDVDPQHPKTPAGYVQVIANPYDAKPWAHFRGVCTKCGFQSYQPTEALAKQMIEIHAGKHMMGQ